MLSGIVDFVTIIGLFFSKCRKNLINNHCIFILLMIPFS